MKQLITHLLKVNKDEVISKSLLNCHVQGLHSIMLLNCPGKTIRLYITSKDHTLHRNYESAETLSYHAHHCSLTLHSVWGEFTNGIMKVADDFDCNDCRLYDRWLYQSLINTGDMGFKLDGADYLKKYSSDACRPGDSIYMPGSSIHTVACPENTVNAWMVYEGAEYKYYQPYAWSNKSLSSVNSDGLYIKPTENNIINLLNSVNLL